jgi:hypothetical protein
MSMAVRRDPSVTSTKGFIDWAIKNQNVLF